MPLIVAFRDSQIYYIVKRYIDKVSRNLQFRPACFLSSVRAASLFLAFHLESLVHNFDATTRRLRDPALYPP